MVGPVTYISGEHPLDGPAADEAQLTWALRSAQLLPTAWHRFRALYPELRNPNVLSFMV